MTNGAFGIKLIVSQSQLSSRLASAFVRVRVRNLPVYIPSKWGEGGYHAGGRQRGISAHRDVESRAECHQLPLLEVHVKLNLQRTFHRATWSMVVSCSKFPDSSIGNMFSPVSMRPHVLSSTGLVVQSELLAADLEVPDSIPAWYWGSFPIVTRGWLEIKMETEESCSSSRPLLAQQTGRCMSTQAMQALNDLRRNNQLCDALLRLEDGGTFPVHRAILSSCSTYFRALFTTTLHTSDKTDVLVPGVSSEMMSLILEYAYLRNLPVNQNNVYKLLVTADYLCVIGVLELCSEFLRSSLNEENCIGIMRFASPINLKGTHYKMGEFLMFMPTASNRNTSRNKQQRKLDDIGGMVTPRAWRPGQLTASLTPWGGPGKGLILESSVQPKGCVYEC
uniref:BTB domain-containing protein n=1 Tax=Timema genevievae TaxID=629358 RepID=A0A7R9JWH0_TIMGE|nr:unnamed protein product [Timema genevievae]